MKIAFLCLVLLSGLNSYAGVIDNDYYQPGLPYDFCPRKQVMLLKVLYFMPSADHRNSSGSCIVSAPAYSWYDLILGHEAFAIDVNAQDCNSKDFIKNEQGVFINASVSYESSISMCGSNPGCKYQCRPIVSLLWTL